MNKALTKIEIPTNNKCCAHYVFLSNGFELDRITKLSLCKKLKEKILEYGIDVLTCATYQLFKKGDRLYIFHGDGCTEYGQIKSNTKNMIAIDVTDLV